MKPCLAARAVNLFSELVDITQRARAPSAPWDANSQVKVLEWQVKVTKAGTYHNFKGTRVGYNDAEYILEMPGYSSSTGRRAGNSDVANLPVTQPELVSAYNHSMGLR